MDALSQTTDARVGSVSYSSKVKKRLTLFITDPLFYERESNHRLTAWLIFLASLADSSTPLSQLCGESAHWGVIKSVRPHLRTHIHVFRARFRDLDLEPSALQELKVTVRTQVRRTIDKLDYNGAT
jgi:hypothetical protein